MKVIVCIPTYNERDSIAETIRGICDLNREKLSVIVIDDNSPDGTSDIVEESSRFHPDRVMLIKRERKLGLGSAYNTGFQRALELGAELIVEMDADGSHDPGDLPALIDSISGDVKTTRRNLWLSLLSQKGRPKTSGRRDFQRRIRISGRDSIPLPTVWL